MSLCLTSVLLALSLETSVDTAFSNRWALCYSPRTSLLYSSSVGRVKKSATFTNGLYDWYEGSKEGYGTGMGDCALIDGVALSGCVDRWTALAKRGLGPDDPKMVQTADWAARLARGLLNLSFRHGYAGFVARGLCEEDGRSICSLSSVDQHTHWVHGLWRYARSPMAKKELVEEFRVRVAEVAARMERMVVPARDYNFGLCDGRPDPRGICTMYWGRPKTASARLASVYLAAYDLTKDAHWRELYERFADDAATGAALLEEERAANPQWRWRTPAYTLLQNASSYEVLLGCETNAPRRVKLQAGLRMGAAEADFRARDMWTHPDKTWYGMCADGELALAQLMSPDWTYDETERAIFEKAIRRFHPLHCDTCRAAHLFAAYWRLAVTRPPAAKVDPQVKAELESLRGNFVSTYDKTEQPLYFWAPEQAKESAVPLLVGLHTWSGNITHYNHYIGPLREAKRRGWAFAGSNFRGPNWTPLGCGSDAAVQDIVDAVAYAKGHAKIDPARVYIVGASGGGHMALLMAGRHPEIFAAAAAFCPPAELARWHREMTTLPRLAKYRYGEHLVRACGGTPAEKMSEYLHRSATTHLKNARAAGVAIYIETGIHDGWVGSVPDGHAIRAFNELADEPDRLTEETIAFIEQNQKIPEALAFTGRNPFYSQKNRVHFRRQSANAVLTIFEGGHGGNWPSAYDFVSRQAKGRKADFTVPEEASGKVEALYK